MEENAKYMYGAEINIGIDGINTDTDWTCLAGQLIEDALKAEKAYGELHFAYYVERTLNVVEVRILSCEVETVKQIAGEIRNCFGIKPNYRKLKMYPPTLSHEK